MTTKKATRGASKARKTRDLPTRATASVKGGAKTRDKKYEVTVNGQQFELSRDDLKNS